MFKVWDDINWMDGNEIYSFKSLVEAINFAKEKSGNSNSNDFWEKFWETRFPADAISIDGWAIEKEEA